MKYVLQITIIKKKKVQKFGIFYFILKSLLLTKATLIKITVKTVILWNIITI